MNFKYEQKIYKNPIITLGGLTHRFKPIIPIMVIGPSDTFTVDALIDSGADNTVFPATLAYRIGVDLTNAPTVKSHTVGEGRVSYRCVEVGLLITDYVEVYEWKSVVGFIDAPTQMPLLGQAGMLQFFDVELLSARHRIVINPNENFQGKKSNLKL